MGAFGVLDIQRSEQYLFLYSAYLGVVYSLWAIRPYTSPTKGRACILFIPVIDLMNIILAFDYSSTTIFVPDGYVSDVEHLRACFFVWGDRIFEKCGIRRDEEGDGGKTLEIRGKRRLSARDGGANYQQS